MKKNAQERDDDRRRGSKANIAWYGIIQLHLRNVLPETTGFLSVSRVTLFTLSRGIFSPSKEARRRLGFSVAGASPADRTFRTLAFLNHHATHSAHNNLKVTLQQLDNPRIESVHASIAVTRASAKEREREKTSSNRAIGRRVRAYFCAPARASFARFIYRFLLLSFFAAMCDDGQAVYKLRYT